MTKTCRQYLVDIINNVDRIKKFVAGITKEEFINDEKTHFAVIRALTIIGEVSQRVPAQLKQKYSSIPWQDIKGMRNKIVHNYDGIDFDILWDTIEEDLNILKDQISAMLLNIGNDEFF